MIKIDKDGWIEHLLVSWSSMQMIRLYGTILVAKFFFLECSKDNLDLRQNKSSIYEDFLIKKLRII